MPAALTRLPQISRWIKGLVTQRNPIDTPFSVVGQNVVAHNDALIDGSNIENSSNNTLVRRWGLSLWSTAAYVSDPTQHIDGIWSFRNLAGLLRTIVSGSVGLRWITPTTATQIIPPGLNPFADFWSIAVTGDYMYATAGSGTVPIRWQPEHPQSLGATQFQMGLATPTAKPIINVDSLDMNKWTSLFIPTGDSISGTWTVNQPDNFVNFTMAIVGTSIAIQWIFSNYPVGPGPITTVASTTVGAQPASVGVDPENGQATVNITLTAAGTTIVDIVTALIDNTKLSVDTYGIPQVTFTRILGNIIANGSLYTVGNGEAFTVTLSPLSDAPNSGLADNTSTNYSLQMFPGTIPTISYFYLPPVKIDDLLTGTVIFSTRTDNGAFTDTSVSVSNVTAQGLVNAIDAAIPGFFAVNLQRTGDIAQVAVLPVQPGPETISNTTWTISSNSLFNVTSNSNISWQQFNVNTGAVKPLNFNKFGYVLKNDVIGHVSTMSDSVTFNKPSFGSTVQIVVRSDNRDPQVTGTELYATSDGGSSFLLTPQFFTVGMIGLTQIRTFYYFTPDAQLNPQVVAPLDGINNPPQSDLQGLVKHTLRMWGFVGNRLYYSGGPDTTNGLGDEAWSPSDNFQFPGPIIKLLSTAQGLFVFLNDDLHIVEGTDKASYYPHILASNFGISNPRAAVYDGQTVFMYTTAKQLHAVSPNQQDEIGYDIGDVLQQEFDPLITELAYHRGPSTDNALFVSNGVDQMFRFTPKGWSVVGDYASIGTIASIETSPGVIQLLAAQSKQTHTGPLNIWFRDYASYQDLGVPFTAFAVVGGISLVNPGSLVPVDNLIVQGTAVGSDPSMSILLNELSGPFSAIAAKSGPLFDPPTQRMPSTTLRQKRYYVKDSLTPITELANTLFVRFDFPAENAKNEIFGLYVRSEP